MTDLTTWLLEQIAEDERNCGPEDGFGGHYCDATAGAHYEADRVLAECAAKRRIVEACLPDYRDALTNGDDTTSLAEEVLAQLALPYSDRDGYLEEWRP